MTGECRVVQGSPGVSTRSNQFEKVTSNPAQPCTSPGRTSYPQVHPQPLPGFDEILTDVTAEPVRKPPRIPAWLAHAQGDTYRTARLRTCPRCHAPVLAGLDADICAFSVRADLTPIDETGEALALLTRRRTFDLVSDRHAKKLYAREEHNIRMSRRYPVLPEHRCGQSLTAHCVRTDKMRMPISEVPPF